MKPSSIQSNRSLGILLQLALLAFFVTLAALATKFQLPLMDDVYITLRHALNFARGDGLVYNPGEHVLAATSPLYALFLSAFYPLTHNLVPVALYSWPLFVGAAGLVAFHLVGRGPAGALGALLICTEPTLLGVVGMDTAFYVFCLLLALLLFQRDRLRPAALLLGAMPMVRPDGIFLIGSVGLIWLLENRRSLNAAFLKRNLPLFLLLAMPLVAWCAVSIPYFGTPLPNSFVGKYYQGKIRWWWPDDASFLHQYVLKLQDWRARFLVAGSLIGLVLSVLNKDRTLRTTALWTALYFGAYSASHVPAYGNYFFPLAAVMTVLTLRTVALLGRQSRLAPSRAALGAGAVALLAFVHVGRTSERILFRDMPATQPMAYVRIAEYLKAHTPANASVGAMEIGILGYFSERKIVDFAGLASVGVAKAIANGDVRFALNRYHPDYVVTRYPIPARLEGGLTERELASGYKWLFGQDGVGLFEPVQNEPPTMADLKDYENTVFILREPVDPVQVIAMNKGLPGQGNSIAASYAASNADAPQKRFAYLSFKDGRAQQIKPVLEPAEFNTFAKGVRLEFDKTEDKLGAWNQVQVSDPRESRIELTTLGGDAYLSVPVKPFAPWFLKKFSLRVRITPDRDCLAQPQGAVHWLTNLDGAWGAREKSLSFSLASVADWQDIEVDLTGNAAWNGSGIITALRFDPINCRAKVELDFFRIE